MKEKDYINVKNLILLRTIVHCLQEMDVERQDMNLIRADMVGKSYGWIMALEEKV